MNVGQAVTLTALLVNIALAVFVLSRQPKNPQAHYFAALAASVFGWGWSLYLIQVGQGVLFAKFAFVFGALIPAAWLWFCLSFPRQIEFPRVSFVTQLFLAFPVLLFAMAPSLGLLSPTVEFGAQGISGDPGLLFPLFNLYFASYSLGGFGVLIWKYMHAKGIPLAQIRYIFMGTLLFAGLAGTTNIILPALGIYRYNILGPGFSLIQLGFIFYSIIAHRLFDIRVIVRKTVIYSGLLAFVIGTYSLIIFTLGSLLGTTTGVSRETFLPNLIAALVVAFGFEPIRRWLVATTDKYLFVGEYRPEDVIRELSKSLSGVIDLDEALQGMMQILVKNMRLKGAATFVLRRFKEGVEVKRVKQMGFTHPKKLKLSPNDPLIAHFEERLKERRDGTTGQPPGRERRHFALVTEELGRRIEEDGKLPKIVPDVYKRLTELKAAVALPIIVKSELIGILTLSEKLSGDIFTSSDLDLLEIVAHETAGSIEKARFWEEDQLKSEFVSIASHELLTPTSTIQGYLSMILDEGMGKVDPKAREYLERVRVTSKRLTELVQDLLNVSRIEAGRIKINLEPMDLLQSIRQVVEELTPQANSKGLSLHFEDPARRARMENGELKMENVRNSPLSIVNSQFVVSADPERVRQILVNLIGNAIKYTPKGGVTVSATRESRFVRVVVADTGIGMAPEEKKHLFEKFYRIQNERTQGIIGTGLGLYIAKNIIELMGGTIGVESSTGRGSVFSFTLPSAPAVTPPDKHSK